MKTSLQFTICALVLCGSQAWSQSPVYTNFIRQTQFPTQVIWDASVAAQGQQLSALAINPGGARFDLWTVKSTPLTNYLLDTAYVGAYVPVAAVVIRSEDPYATIPRTRADRPFYVDITVNGLLTGPTDPEPSKSVKFLRHVQSYGADNDGINVNRSQATLLTQSVINQNGGPNTLTFALNSVPGGDRSKVRGEERFSVFSLADYQAPESQIASQFIQIWPVADGTVSGIAANQLIRYAMPQLTITLNDLYPNSTTYAQVYKGTPRLGVDGTVVPGSAVVVNDSVPQDRVLVLTDYDSAFGTGDDADGQWTMELLTVTPFGTDRLSHVTFTLDRTIAVNGSFTTIE
jgi:hypothetical protein